MSRKLIVHIGHPKTGTTSLQSSLFQSRDQLRRHGVLYPHGLEFRNHKALMGHFCPADTLRPRLRKALGGTDSQVSQTGADAWRQIEHEIEEYDPRVIILSAEHFFHIGRTPQMPRFITALRKLAPELHFVAYLRAPEEHFLSIVQQNLKNRDSIRRFDPSYFQKNLSPLLGIPETTLTAIKYSRETLVGGDIVTDFGSRFLPDNHQAALSPSETPENVSVSAEAMMVLQGLRHGDFRLKGQARSGINQRVLKDIFRVDSELPEKMPPRLNPGVAAYLHDQRTDLGWTRDKLGISFPRPPENSGGIAPNFDMYNVAHLCVLNEPRLADLMQRLSVEA